MLSFDTEVPFLNGILLNSCFMKNMESECSDNLSWKMKQKCSLCSYSFPENEDNIVTYRVYSPIHPIFFIWKFLLPPFG